MVRILSSGTVFLNRSSVNTKQKRMGDRCFQERCTAWSAELLRNVTYYIIDTLIRNAHFITTLLGNFLFDAHPHLVYLYIHSQCDSTLVRDFGAAESTYFAPISTAVRHHERPEL